MLPIMQFPATFLTLFVLFCLPQLYHAEFPGLLSYLVVQWAHGFLINWAFAYLFVLLIYGASKIHKFAKYVFLMLVHILAYGLYGCELFLNTFFEQFISANTLQLLLETTGQESSEFVSTYILTFDFGIKILAVLALIALLEFGFSVMLKTLKWNKIVLFLFSIYTVWSFGYVVKTGLTMNTKKDTYWNMDRIDFPGSLIFKTYASILQFVENQGYAEPIMSACDKAQVEPASCDIEDLVIIVGESYNKYHSSLYGYNHETNPKLKTLENLFVFNKVLTATNQTSEVFKNIMSVANVNDSLRWCDVPLFPAIFKEAGFNVAFYSNQFIPSLPDKEFVMANSACGFFHHPQLSQYLWSRTNTEKYAYDGDLLNAYKQERESYETDKHNC